MANNPMTYLKEVIDPMIAAASDENPLADDEFLSLIDIDILDQVPEGNIVELYGAFSDPSVYVGDRWMYDPSERGMNFGKMKLKKMTISIKVTEDEMSRMIKRGDSSITKKMIKRQMKDQVLYLRETIIKQCLTGPANIATDADLDPLIYGFFELSSDGTISNPSDLGAVAGTITDADVIDWTGAAQTPRNVPGFVTLIKPRFVKLDFLTHIQLPTSGPIYMLVHPTFKAMLESSYDILDSTTGRLSLNTQAQDLAKAGIILLASAHVDVLSSFADGDSNDYVCFTNPTDFTLWLAPPAEGTGWDDWSLIDDGKSKYYIKRKKIEFGLEIQAYGLHTSASEHGYFKTVVPFKTTPMKA